MRRPTVLIAAATVLTAGCSSGTSSSPSTTAAPASASTVPESTAPPTTAAAGTAPTTPATTHPPETTEPHDTEPPHTTEPTDPLAMATDLGPIRGTTSAVDGVRAFLDIPYAEPPVGDLRFAPPVRRAAWTDELDATSPGAACPQLDEGPTAQFTVIPEWDDDCLSLSVWAPEGADHLPVLVWFHGGGFTSGSAHQPYYIGDQLAGRGAVVVNVNYRLGALGFLDGNWGLLDQIAALDWVHRNIAEFGGDPEHVTIFGESAGGFSVCGHLATPQPGVFHQAIIQSGGGCDRLQELDEANAATAALLDAASCADIECLRAVPTADLLALPFNPVLINDKVTLDRTALDLAVSRELPSRPVINGFNADEATLFTVGQPEPTDEELVGLVEVLIDDPQDAAAVLALYPADQFETRLDRYREIWTDVVFACPAIAFADATDNTFVYEFSYVSPSTPFDLGATHGAELAFLFGHPEGLTILESTLDPADQRVSDRLQEAWVAFAATGSPGWDHYDHDAGGVLDIGVDDTFVDTVRGGRCTALNELT